MDRGTWGIIVHGIAESDTTEETEHACKVRVTLVTSGTHKLQDLMPDDLTWS